MIPPEGAPGEGQRRGPSGWSGPLIVVFALLGVVFAYLLVELARWRYTAGGSAAAPATSVMDLFLLGAGAITSWAIAGVLIRWRRARR